MFNCIWKKGHVLTSYVSSYTSCSPIALRSVCYPARNIFILPFSLLLASLLYWSSFDQLPYLRYQYVYSISQHPYTIWPPTLPSSERSSSPPPDPYDFETQYVLEGNYLGGLPYWPVSDFSLVPSPFYRILFIYIFFFVICFFVYLYTYKSFFSFQAIRLRRGSLHILTFGVGWTLTWRICLLMICIVYLLPPNYVTLTILSQYDCNWNICHSIAVQIRQFYIWRPR
jgi:hypothetical protein